MYMTQEGMRALSTLAPLGAGVFAKACVPDTSRLLVDIGLGFHAECRLDEALEVAALRLEHLAQRAEERNRQVGAGWPTWGVLESLCNVVVVPCLAACPCVM